MTTTAPAFPKTVQPESDALDAVKPRYSLNGDENNYVLRVELPGVKKDGLEINLDQSVLTLKAKRVSGPMSNWRTLHSELRDLNYALRLKLNLPVDDTKMTAKLEDGVLNLTLPVKEAAKPRRITVQ